MPDATEIVIVLDRSGSMNSIRDDIIGGLNSFIEEQKKQEGEATLTLCQFDYEYEIVYNNIDINDIPKFTRNNFVPRGSTALLDAIGRTINEVSARRNNLSEDDSPSKVIFAIITDGEENSSHEFQDKSKILEMIKNAEENDWAFTFLGANQDAIKEAGAYGIHTNSAMTYSASSGGTQSVMNSFSNQVSATRSIAKGASIRDSISYGDRDRADAIDASGPTKEDSDISVDDKD